MCVFFRLRRALKFSQKLRGSVSETYRAGHCGYGLAFGRFILTPNHTRVAKWLFTLKIL